MRNNIPFSVVVPIRNETQFLPYSLPSIFSLSPFPSEVILLFDRCTDNSLALAKKIAKRCGFLDRTRFVVVNEECDWRFRQGYVRRLGFKMAKNDVILTTDADIILDGKIAEYISLINERVKLIVFERIDFPFTYQNMIVRLLQRLPSAKLYRKFTGIYVFSKRAWLETEDEGVKKIEYADDTYLQLAISRKYPSRFILTKTYHLRPRETKEVHYVRGRHYWSVAHRPILLTIISGTVLLRPSLIRGYIHERFGRG